MSRRRLYVCLVCILRTVIGLQLKFSLGAITILMGVFSQSNQQRIVFGSGGSSAGRFILFKINIFLSKAAKDYLQILHSK